MTMRRTPRHLFLVLLASLLVSLGLTHAARGEADQRPPASQPAAADETPTLPAIPAPDFSRLQPYKVVHVRTADSVTIRIGRQQVPVRFLGVEPYGETATTTGRAKSFSRQAALFLRNLLSGERIYMVADEDAAVGASAVYVYRAPDGLFINAELIRQGYAYAVTARPYAHRTAFVAYERNAARVRKGLWALPADARHDASARAPAAETAQDKKPAGTTPLKPPHATVPSKPQQSALRRARQSPELLGDKQSFIYHGPVCRLRDRIVFPQQIDSPRDAAAKGYRPCRICKPPR